MCIKWCSQSEQGKTGIVVFFKESFPPHGLSLGTAGQRVYRNFHSLIRRGGAPSGAAAFIARGKTTGMILVLYVDDPNFIILKKNLFEHVNEISKKSYFIPVSPIEKTIFQAKHPAGMLCQ